MGPSQFQGWNAFSTAMDQRTLRPPGAYPLEREFDMKHFYQNLMDLFSEDNSRLSTQFALAIFLTFSGFMVATSVYLVYALWFRQDLPPMIANITAGFILQSVAGAVASLFNRPKDQPPAPPQVPGGV